MKRHAVIFLNDGPWLIATTNADGQSEPVWVDGEGDPSQRVEQLERALREIDFDPNAGDLTLALPTGWCASATVRTADLPRRDRSTAMAYRLEEQLPYAAEQFTATFIPDNGSSLGVCVLTERLAPVTKSLVERGYRIHAVMPSAMLVAQSCTSYGEDRSCSIVLWRHSVWCEAITLNARGVPVSWVSLNDDPTAIALHLNLLALRRAQADTCVYVFDDDTDRPSPEVGASSGFEIKRSPENPYKAVAAFAELLFAGKASPWIDFNREALGEASRGLLRRPIKVAMVACVLMLVCLNTAFLFRAHRYDGMSHSYRQQEAGLYADLFVGQTPPIEIHTRLAGELKLISGLRGRSEAIPPHPATFSLLHAVLASLPNDTRHRILELRIEDDSVYIDGQARSHGDVSGISKALSRGGLHVETRHTEQLINGQGVGFVMIASDGTKRREAVSR